MPADEEPMTTPTKLRALRPEEAGEYGPNVRIVCKPAAGGSCDLVLQKRASPAYPWREEDRYNDSDCDAALYADRAARELSERFKIAALS
jgi:hypothetical protein